MKLCYEYDLSLPSRLVLEFPDVEMLQAHAKEAIILAHACHLNVLPFYGLYIQNKKMCIVTPWIENSNVMSCLYPVNRADSDRPGLRKELQSLLVRLLHQVSPFQRLT